ncbi:MAG: hypothetical protein V3T14_00065 [Myxococcota bacterium]
MRHYWRSAFRSIRGPLLGGVTIGLTFFGAPAPAQHDAGLEIEDRLDVLRLDRRLLAVSADGDRTLEVRLRPGEQVLRLESKGLIGVAATRNRLLGVTTRSGSWQEVRLRVRETEVPEIHLSERLVMIPMDTRLLALTRGGGIWTELQLLPGEKPIRVEVAPAVGLCLTQRRAIGLSAEGGGFIEINLGPRETVEAVALKDRSVTVRTVYRLLLFTSGASRWTELRRTDFRGLPPG